MMMGVANGKGCVQYRLLRTPIFHSRDGPSPFISSGQRLRLAPLNRALFLAHNLGQAPTDSHGGRVRIS
jgi:hypothetical protein